MSRQFLIIGLGQFGSSLARALAHHGNEVIVADSDAGRVAELAPHVADAVVVDGTDEVVLARLGPAQRDVCVCAIGGDSRESSIITTALLRQLGARRVLARAADTVHARILALVGAHEVVNPEEDFGERLAIRLAWRHVINVLPLGGDLVLTEIVAPESFWGRTLAELELRRRFGVTVAAVRREGPAGVVVGIPDPHQPFLRGDALMLVSAEGAARLLTEGPDVQLRREASVGIVAILVLQVLLALLAITLLTRMGPAIGWILQENVYSAEAVEAMLAELAAGQDEAAFDEGLAHAQANVTEAEEPAVLVRIAAQRTAALAGPGPARAAVVRDLREIGAINRASMVRANGRAGRLGLGGAWAAALLGALAVGLGVLVYRRLSLRLEIPIQDVRLTLERLRAGNPQARCALLESPAELRQIAKDLNWLADRWLERSRPAAPPRGEAELRRLLAVLLDREPGPAQAVDGDDDIVAQNLAALELLAAPVAGAWEDEAVAGTTLRLRRWAPA